MHVPSAVAASFRSWAGSSSAVASGISMPCTTRMHGQARRSRNHSSVCLRLRCDVLQGQAEQMFRGFANGWHGSVALKIEAPAIRCSG